jgi:CubicO group peptidase (beta-lactamase class C family)
MKRSILLPLFAFIIIHGNAQDFDQAKLDSLFSRIESNQQSMGSVSIYKDGKEVYANAIGFADLDKGIKAGHETKYRIGSISKTFTSVIILQLVEEGKLSLETTLDKYYPSIPNASKVTIEQLLRHRSGLFNFTNDPAYLEWMEAPKSEDELIEIFKKNGTVSEPDEKFEYSNTNYVLLSFIVEQIENKVFSEVFDQRITKGLKLPDTYYGGVIGQKPNEAKSYNFKEGWKLATETDMSIPTGAGAIVSTPSDLNTFFHALFQGEVVSEESLKRMTTLEDGYGLGLFQLPFYDRRAFGHNGGIDGFQSNASYFQDDGVGLVYITNGTVMSLNDILIGVLSIYFDKDYALPTFVPAIEISSAELDQYLGIYSSEALPLKITISKDGNQLMAQATGQSAFPLEPYEAHKFRFNPAGIKLEFIPEDKKMILNQGGGRFEFSMEE